MSKKTYDADSISYALDKATERGDILGWSFNEKGRYVIDISYLPGIGIRTLTLNQVHAFLIGLITGKGI